MTVSNIQQRNNATVWDPFIGPRPFTRMLEDQKIFFGREDEADDIITLILGHKAVLVYSQSGVGKTSIFEAKIVPTLEKDYEFNVLPTARVGSSNKFEFTLNELSSQFVNFYMLNAFQSLIDDIDPYLVYNKSLFEFLNEYFPSDKNGNNKQKLLIFDQFEELFIFYPDDNCKKQQENFFEQVAEALERDLFLRIVFVIREDY